MEVFNEESGIDSRKVKSSVVHHYLIIKPDQINRLKHLADAANPLFKPGQNISVIELLYAALWRHVGKGGLCPRVTIVDIRTVKSRTVESHADDSCSSTRSRQHNSTLKFSAYTLTGAADYLGSEPLISIAHRIRCCMANTCDDYPYEGWLVDSLVENGAVHPTSSGLGDLVLSMLPFPDLQEFLHRESGRSTLSAVMAEDNNLAEGRLRICCINVGKRSAANMHEDTIPEAVGALSPEWCQQDLISVDMQVAASEIDDLRSLYVDYDLSRYDSSSECAALQSAGPDSGRFGRGSYGLDLAGLDSQGLTGCCFLRDEFFDN